MTAHVYRDACGDSLTLTAQPEDGEVRIWGWGQSSPVDPAVIIHTARPLTLYTDQVVNRVECAEHDHGPSAGWAFLAGLVLGLGIVAGGAVLALFG